MTVRFAASRWLLGPLTALLLLAAIPSALAQQRVGAATAVNPDTNGTAPGAAIRQVVIGQDVVHNERISTGATGQTQILFLDQSSLTIGSDADLTIDDFVFDPSTSKGQLVMSATRGILRYVGGALSKNANAVSMVTPSGTLGIRGGIFLLWLAPTGRLDVVFMFGDGLLVIPACQNCTQQFINRPGYFVTIARPGAPASTPAPAPAGFVAQILAALSSTGNGGSKNPPTDELVLDSGLPGLVSGNVAGSDWSALHHLPPFTPPPDLNPSTLQTTLGLNSAFSHGQTITISNQPPPAPAPPTPTPPPPTPPTPPPPPPPPPPFKPGSVP